MFKQRKREAEKEIKVYESQDLSEIAEDERTQIQLGIKNKIEKAQASKQSPFFVEDLLNAEELESL